jgi:hypothetical protein
MLTPTPPPPALKPQIADIKRVNSLASDTALFAREHVLVPTKPLAPLGEDGAQVAMARLLSGRAPLPPQQQTSGRRRTDGWASASMRSGASSRSGAGGRLSLLLDVGIGGGGGDDGGGAGGGYSDEGGGGTPYSRRSDRSFAFTAAAENPGDVELMDRGGGGGGGAAAALADRLTSRRRMVLAGGGSSSPLVLVGPSPSAPNLSAWLGGGSASASGQGQGQQQQPQHDALPPLPRRSPGPPPPPPAAAAAMGGALAPAPPPPLFRQLSEAFGQTALATVDALTRAASQPVLRKRAD